MADATICVATSQRIAVTPNVLADAPYPAQGEIDGSPTLVPSASRVRHMAAATTAPLKTAGQETPEAGPVSAGQTNPSRAGMIRAPCVV